ncbi:hypothetical protein [Halomontanus rarus]|uniref:hypothetical protein n=1 Tax=Halomontanus rarus TaxID=3034020 RepID=UPI001A985F5C
MAKQLTLGGDSNSILSASRAEEDTDRSVEDAIERQKREARYDVCTLCGKAEPKDSGRIEWFNGGSLLSRNPRSHERCYREALRQDHGFREPGFRILSDNHHCWEVFSATTGWEQLDPRDLEAVLPGMMVDSTTVFAHRIRARGEEYGEATDCAVWGVTQDTVEALAAHGYVELPDEIVESREEEGGN